jgi:uncharacterized membrane protein
MRQIAQIGLVAAYLIGMVVAIVSLDASSDGEWATIWAIVSVLLGAGTGKFRFAPLSLLALPIAIPFGLPEDRYSDPVLPIWVAAMYFALFSFVLILLSALARQGIDSRLRRRRAARDSGVA